MICVESESESKPVSSFEGEVPFTDAIDEAWFMGVGQVTSHGSTELRMQVFISPEGETQLINVPLHDLVPVTVEQFLSNIERIASSHNSELEEERYPELIRQFRIWMHIVPQISWTESLGGLRIMDALQRGLRAVHKTVGDNEALFEELHGDDLRRHMEELGNGQ